MVAEPKNLSRTLSRALEPYAIACDALGMTTQLLTEIDQFLSETGLSEGRFGLLAVRNGRLVERLRKGDPILNSTEARVREFLAEARRSGFRKRQARRAAQ